LSKKWHKKGQHQESPGNHQQPSCHGEIKWPSVYPVRIEPSPEEDKKYAEEQLYKKKQLRVSKTLNWITGCAALVGLFGLIYLRGQLRQMKVSNEQTKLALHVSERAYLTVGGPILDIENGLVTLGRSNIGRIPSGYAQVIVHAATANQPTLDAPADLNNAVGRFWKKVSFPSVIPSTSSTPPFSIAVPAKSYSKAGVEAGTQVIVVAGYVTYNDGFPDDPSQESPFCEYTVRHSVMKRTVWVPCDAKSIVPIMETLDVKDEDTR